MHMKILLVLGLVWLTAVCNARPADAEYDEYEDEPPPPPPPKPTRANPLKNRRNPLTGRASVKSGSSTTTPPPPPVPEGDAEDGEGGEDEEISGPPSSTTEVPKKFKTGSVRPFRSNDDLLAALKRRREQAASHKSATKPAQPQEDASPPDAMPSAPSKNRVTSGGRKRFNHNKAEALPSSDDSAAPAAPTRTARRFSPRA